MAGQEQGMVARMIIIATFFSHFGAVRFKKQCDAAGWVARMKPVPRTLSSSCGTCVEYSPSLPGPDQPGSSQHSPKTSSPDQPGSNQHSQKKPGPKRIGSDLFGSDQPGSNHNSSNRAEADIAEESIQEADVRNMDETVWDCLPRDFSREEVEQAVEVTPEGYRWIYRADNN